MLETDYKSILKTALPLMLSGFIQSILSMTDAAFLSRSSDLAYAAAGSAGLWYITLHMAFIGLADGAQILIGNAIGEQKKNRIGTLLSSSMFNMFLVALLLTCLVQFLVPKIMYNYVGNTELNRAELDFLSIRSYAFWANIFFMSLQSYYYGSGKTTVVLIASALVATTNMILAYLFVFGFGSIPEMGLKGAALASTLAEIIGMLFLVVRFLSEGAVKKYDLKKTFKLSKNYILEHLKIGFPLILQGFVALSVWTVFFIWIEQIGHDELTISLNIRYIYFLAFVPIWGFAGAAKTYISQYVGAKKFDAIPGIQRKIQILTIGFLLLTFHGALFYPEKLIELVNNDQKYVQQSAQLLQVVFGSILIYGYISVYYQTVSASRNTKVTFIIECLCTGAYFCAAYVFIHVLKASLNIIWLVEYVYFITMGFAAYIYLKTFNWKKIENE